MGTVRVLAPLTEILKPCPKCGAKKGFWCAPSRHGPLVCTERLTVWRADGCICVVPSPPGSFMHTQTCPFDKSDGELLQLMGDDDD